LRLSPLERGPSPLFEKSRIPFTQEWFMPPPDPWGPWCEQFWIYIISESFHVNIAYSGSVVLEKKIFKWAHPIFEFFDFLPFEEDPDLYLNNLEFPLPKDDLCQVWLKLASWFWRRFLKMFSVFLLFCDYPPLEKGNPLHFNHLESPSLKDDLCQVWLKLAQWFWRKSRKCKSLQTDGPTDGRTTDNGRSE
jgi:hypothetical protein